MPMDLSMKAFFSRRTKKITDELQLRFLQRLDRFLSNGYPLIDALQAITWDKDLKEMTEEIIRMLKNGTSLDIALEKTGFHSTISSFLYFVKANSDLQESIRKCEEMYALRVKNIQKFKQILRYPLVLLFFFSIILFFIHQQVLPSFQSLFQSSTESLTTIKLSMLIIDLFSYCFIIAVIISIGSIVGLRVAKRKLAIEQQIKIYERLPFYRPYLSITTSFHFATHFSSLIKSGLSLKEILTELKNQKKLPILAYYAELLIIDLNRGFHISSLLTQLSFINQQLATIFQKDVNTHDLEKDLRLYSEILLDEMQRKIMQAITIIQPIFYIVIGLFIIFIYLSIMWPMFKLINTF